MKLDGLGSMHPPKAAIERARIAQAIAQATQQNNVATIAQENSPANKLSLLPLNAVYLIGGTPFTPGVNATFGLGISQTDLDNLRAGKVLYQFYPARMVVPPRAPHVRTTRPAVLQHARAVPSWMMGSLVTYLNANPRATLAQVNQFLSVNQQKSEQQDNSSFNKNALIAIAAFATAGYAAAGAAGAGAGASSSTLATGATVDASLPGLTASELATETANATAALSASDAAAAAALPGLTSTELATETANATAALATPSVTTSTSLLTQAGNWASSQIPTTDSLITSAETAASTKATKLITGMLSPPAPAATLSTAAPSLSTIPASAPAPTKSLTSTIMPLILGGLSLLAFLK